MVRAQLNVTESPYFVFFAHKCFANNLIVVSLHPVRRFYVFLNGQKSIEEQDNILER